MLNPTPRSWFAVSPGQSAAAVVLTVLLLMNLTVLALMFTGDLAVTSLANDARVMQGDPDQPQVLRQSLSPAATDQPALESAAIRLVADGEPAPAVAVDMIHVGGDPIQHRSPSITPAVTGPLTTPPAKVAAIPSVDQDDQPEQDEPSATFFGIDIK